MKPILSSLLLLIQACTYAQNYAPPDSVQIDFTVAEHWWGDSNRYQFIALSVTGLPEINTFNHKANGHDSIDVANLQHILTEDIFSGGYSFVIVISRHQTFHPIKTIKEVIYDSISKSDQVKHTSLFLIDDFDKIKKREPLLIFSRGCFGYQTQSYADCNDFIAELNYDKSLVASTEGSAIANKSWYTNWIKSAPKDYWNPRVGNYFGEKHNYFESYSGRIKTEPNKKKGH